MHVKTKIGKGVAKISTLMFSSKKRSSWGKELKVTYVQL